MRSTGVRSRLRERRCVPSTRPTRPRTIRCVRGYLAEASVQFCLQLVRKAEDRSVGVGTGGYRPAMPASPALEAVFPNCYGCRHFADGPVSTCFACAEPQLSRPTAAACPLCAQYLRSDGLCPNELCRSPRRRITKIHAIGYQSGALRRAINSYKYRGSRGLSVVFARLLLAWLEQNMAADPPGLIVANPSFVGPGGQEFAHTETVLAAAARAATSEACWAFDTATPAAVIKVAPTLKSAD